MLIHTLQPTQTTDRPNLDHSPFVLSVVKQAPCFRFQPLSHSWVALHPQPKGVIQFIGGAFFGTYPTLFYRRLLRPFFEAGYTIVALPFRFTFSHWSIALSLLEEHYCIREAMIEVALRKPGYETDVYLDAASYGWVGHSLGCKYVALLELLSCPEEILMAHFDTLNHKDGLGKRQRVMIAKALKALTETLKRLEASIQRLTGKPVDYGVPSIYNEASLLLAPAITDLDGAIPIKSLERLFRRVLTVYPTVEQTHLLIARSRLFNMTHLFEFDLDAIARSTCQRLVADQPHITASMLRGRHLSPLSWNHHDHNMADLLIPNLSQFFEKLNAGK